MLKINELSVVRDQRLLRYNLAVKTGECVAIQGPSGVGKTTLLHLIAGFLAADSGQILWHRQALTSLPASARPVSMLFQDYNLFEHISALANLRLGFPKGPESAPEAALQQAAQALGVTDQLDKLPSALSGGQRQRIALIRTLLRPEPLVLLDEPFAELDPASRQQAIVWVRQQARTHQKTLLVVTHQQEDVELLAADRILQLSATSA